VTGPQDTRQRGRFAVAFGFALVLSVLLGWLPVIGPWFAGYAAGLRARSPALALAAALIPAAVWTGGLLAASQRAIHLGGWETEAGPLAYLAPVTGIAMLSGALMGTRKRPGRILGALALVIALAWFYPRAADVYRLGTPFMNRSDTPRTASMTADCPDHLKKLYTALQFYGDDWEGRLPPAAHWMTLIKDKGKDPELHCPAVGTAGNRYGYAMNPALSGQKLDSLTDRDKTPLLYDSTDLSLDAHAGPDSLPDAGRHDGKNSVLYADGKVRQQ
jgi:hypothetical protein